MPKTVEMDYSDVRRRVFWQLFVFSTFVMPKKYTSSVDLYVTSKIVEQGGSVDLNSINASQKLVNAYIAVLAE